MCVVSMVYDHYKPQFPWNPAPAPYVSPLVDKQAVEELRRLIAEFREAVAAAKRVDDLTGQADCADHEKATLEERVRRLEIEVGLVDD